MVLVKDYSIFKIKLLRFFANTGLLGLRMFSYVSQLRLIQ